jgi:hypothetical protein
MASTWEQIGLVVAGAVIGVFPTIAIERMKWRYQDRQAWRDERRRVYADFLVRVSSLEHDTVQLAREMSSGRLGQLSADNLRHPAAIEDDVLRELVRERNAVAEQMITSYETLKLVSTATSIRFAQAIIDKYNEMLALARDGTFDPAPAWNQARQRLRDSQRDFREAARKEIMGKGAESG